MKKKTYSVLAYLLGSLCAAALVIGVVLLVPSEILHNALAIAIICLSICFGILTANPLFFCSLLTGVCILMLPSYVMAIVLLTIGSTGAVVNLLGWKKHFRND